LDWIEVVSPTQKLEELLPLLAPRGSGAYGGLLPVVVDLLCNKLYNKFTANGTNEV